MDVLVFMLVLALVAAVAILVTAPLRGGRAELAADRQNAELAALAAAKEAKYREIRELELDHRTGKLSDEDFRRQDRVLRAEAVELLERIDELGGLEASGTERP